LKGRDGGMPACLVHNGTILAIAESLICFAAWHHNGGPGVSRQTTREEGHQAPSPSEDTHPATGSCGAIMIRFTIRRPPSAVSIGRRRQAYIYIYIYIYISFPSPPGLATAPRRGRALLKTTREEGHQAPSSSEDAARETGLPGRQVSLAREEGHQAPSSRAVMEPSSRAIRRRLQRETRTPATGSCGAIMIWFTIINHT
jgi:hypothetical protein